MTTDNRANEPTEVQVKLAYLAHLKAPRTRGMDIYGPMRAALEAAARAAQGAAPQAEQATYLNVAHSSVLAGSINARRAAREVSAMQLIDAIYDPDEDDANDSVRYGYVLEQFERLRIIYADLDDPDAGPAPVLPSSGVDEGALAEVIAKSRGFGNGWTQIPPLTREAYREVARAVAEWLKEQGR